MCTAKLKAEVYYDKEARKFTENRLNFKKIIVYLNVTQEKICKYAKGHAFRLLVGKCITPSSCKIAIKQF